MSWGEVKKINSNLNTPLNEGGIKIVKSVQRGVGSATSIAISEVNPDKCIVLIDGIVTTSLARENVYGSDRYFGNSIGGATLESLTSDAIAMSNVKNTYSWQLVEFY